MRTRFGWVALGLLAAGVGLAQEGDALEIRGYVAEMGLNAGIGGVQITVYQFSKESERSVFATGSTDALGNFIFHPSQAGVYYVEARKLEYLATVGYKGPTDKLPDVTGSVISLSRDHPREFVRFVMMRLGEMTGRVVDENEKPMEGVTVQAVDPALLQASLIQGARTEARTGRDGGFRVKGLPPGQYIVRISGGMLKASSPVTKFSDEDLNGVATDVGTSYWPGGRDASSAAKVTVMPGSGVDLGAVRLRKEPLYRVRVSVKGCRAGDDLQFSLTSAGQGFKSVQANGATVSLTAYAPFAPVAGCDDFLIRDLAPGSYEFALQSKQGWAISTVEVVNKNLFVTIGIGPDADVTGVLVPAYQGMTMPVLGRGVVMLVAQRPFGTGGPILSQIPSGTFSFKKLRGPQFGMTVSGVNAPYYVKEIRTNGVAAAGGMVTVTPGAQIEVVIDDQPATLAGVVTEDGKGARSSKVYMRPVAGAMSGAESSPTGVGDGSGRFQMAGVAPGEYRVLALPEGPIPDGAAEWNVSEAVWDRAERVVLERGKRKEVELKLVDPYLAR